jgi:two-component system cell cycle sensor histidine kinase/response regulator CckA
MFFKKKEQEAQAASAPSGKKWHVLAIDDDSEFRQAIRQVLESEGFEVTTASTGVKGLEMYARDKDTIDLVLLDISMPTLDGEKTFDWLRKLKPDVKVIVVSGTEELYLKELEAKYGIPYIQKPFKLEHVQRIRHVLQKKD